MHFTINYQSIESVSVNKLGLFFVRPSDLLKFTDSPHLQKEKFDFRHNQIYLNLYSFAIQLLDSFLNFVT